MQFPDGKRFAFTILDDTDDATLENIRPVYDQLRDLGFRTTKTVWPMDCPEGSQEYFAADTLQRPDYLEYIRSLAEAGFEIASHGATMEPSLRSRTLRGLDFLEREFGSVPKLHANHGQNSENIHWGYERFQSPLIRTLIRVLGRHAPNDFTGEREGSPFFWGDLCKEHFDYVRNFTFSELDMMGPNRQMPYRLASTPCVAHWFSTTDVPDVKAFRRSVSRTALERLEDSGGVCIISTHLGKGFASDNQLDPEVQETLVFLADRPGWYVPVSTLLDYLRDRSGDSEMGRLALFRLEMRFLMGQLGDRLRDRINPTSESG